MGVFFIGLDANHRLVPVADTFEEFGKMTIADLKRKIHERIPEVETKRMRLLFAGKQLEETRNGDIMTLADYYLKKDSTIQLVLRLPCGISFSTLKF